MQEDKSFLGTQPIKKLLPKLAVPTVIAQLVNMLYNIVDRIYIGHIPEVGSLALTGIGVCMPLILIVSAFSAFVASGGAPRASIFMGRGDCDSAERTLGGCLTMQVIISLLLTAAMLIWKDELLYLFGASENTIYYAADYMGIYALGTIFVQITLGLNAFITAQGFAKVGMKTVIIGAVLNIVLDPVFIFALGMGVKGAALATIISQAVSCAWVISFLCGGKTVLRLKKENLLPGLRLMPIANIPVGTVIHNIELHPGNGAQLVRAAGTSAQLMAKEGDDAQIRMPSGEVRIVRTNCYATIGQVGNIEHENINIGKAGRKRHMGWRPTVRGSVMNPNDHPHGGGEGRAPVGRSGPVTPWGKPALGYKTRKGKNPTSKFIVKRRNEK